MLPVEMVNGAKVVFIQEESNNNVVSFGLKTKEGRQLTLKYDTVTGDYSICPAWQLNNTDLTSKKADIRRIASFQLIDIEDPAFNDLYKISV